jgi:7-cyano-7-deazaguanine reductase
MISKSLSPRVAQKVSLQTYVYKRGFLRREREHEREAGFAMRDAGVRRSPLPLPPPCNAGARWSITQSSIITYQLPVSDDDYISDLKLLKQNESNYPETPDKSILEAFDNRYASRDYWVTFNCPEFTARCPVTNQPDFGAITIRYVPDKRCIESKSLKLYLFAYRNFNTFHEESVNRILDDLVAVCDPREAIVEGIFNPRGGIGIDVTASYRRDDNA